MDKKTRVSVDFPYECHTILKMYCAKKGVSIRQYIIDTVLKSMKEEVGEVDEDTFKKVSNKLMNEKSALWKKLADR